MASLDELLSDCAKLPNRISGAAEAIVQYVSAISGSEWECDTSGQWRPVSENFVTVKPQWKQAGNFAVTIRGEPPEFELRDSLSLLKDQHGYSAFRLETAEQIAAAFIYIERARALFERGRTRVRTTPKTIG
jgi:hypothetical protein